MSKKDKDNLEYYWIADFTDGTTVKQFKKNYTEVSYKEVMDKMDLLDVFTITNDKEEYIVDISKGKIKTPNKNYNIKGNNYTLIYKRRNKVRLTVGGTDLKILAPEVTHIVGIDTDDEDQWIEVDGGQGQRPKKEKHDKKEKKVKNKK